MCAIAGACSHNPEVDAVHRTLSALDATQHRGDASTGIASLSYDNELDVHTHPGLVRHAYPEERIAEMAGSVAIGHNRYPTSGNGNLTQPILMNSLGLAFAHNGTLADTDDLKLLLGKKHVDTKRLNDSGMMAEALAQFMYSGKDAPEAVAELFPYLRGAASCVVQHQDTLVAFRDPLGLRPLSIAEVDGGYMFSSETCGFYQSRSKYVGDVKPGEMVVVQGGQMERHQVMEPDPKFDIFELIYFASPDSEMFGHSVGQIRYQLGQELAKQYPLKGDNYLVVGVPDSGLPIAEGYAHGTGLQKRDVILKHRYWSGRTFMQKNQLERKKYLERKFSYIGEAAVGRDVILVDDSIVRQNTASVITRLMKRAGARSVSFLVGSPPIGYPDFSGIDTPSQRELAASRFTPEEIRQKINCKFLGYLSLSGLINATGQPVDVFNLASFNGDYPYEIGAHGKKITDSVSLKYLEDAWSEAA